MGLTLRFFSYSEVVHEEDTLAVVFIGLTLNTLLRNLLRNCL